MKTFLRLKYNYFPIKKKFKIEKRKILSQVKELISLAILLFARSTYIKSLKGCFADEFKCIVNLQIISDVIYYCLKSILLFFIFIGLLQFKFCSKYLLIIFFFIILELFLRDHEDSLSHHGFVNFRVCLPDMFVVHRNLPPCYSQFMYYTILSWLLQWDSFNEYSLNHTEKDGTIHV